MTFDQLVNRLIAVPDDGMLNHLRNRIRDLSESPHSVRSCALECRHAPTVHCATGIRMTRDDQLGEVIADLRFTANTRNKNSALRTVV